MLFLQTLAILASAIGLVKGQAIDPSEVALSTRDLLLSTSLSPDARGLG
ncbi:hypothetical protein EYZ11_012279 [Aspergillus tanneri]|uniref:Uncharacterized protein n=1 Tax=Aspergillus tanneri TaxID=1220188 RepID=A0A4S3J0X2_9EURO|nr:hypothetical protein EYZ11_012279 [Aspergillus tanneri]